MIFYMSLLPFLLNLAMCQHPSPCPDVFTYEEKSKEHDRWYGVIQLKTSEELVGIWLHISLDKPAELLGNWFGEASSSDNMAYIVCNTEYNLKAHLPLSVRFFVKYNTVSTPPSVKSIRLNGKTICKANTRENKAKPSQDKQPMLSNTGYNNCNRPIEHVSPCPGVFTLENCTDHDKWYGVIQLNTPKDVTGLWLRITFNTRVDQLGNWLGKVSSTDNVDFLIHDPEYILKAGSSKPIRFFVKYNPEEIIPNIKTIKFNGQTICRSYEMEPKPVFQSCISKCLNTY